MRLSSSGGLMRSFGKLALFSTKKTLLYGEGFMLTINPKYIVDDTGEKTAAVLTIKEYHLLIKRLEDLEDILEMDLIVESATDFRSYQEIRLDLQKERRL